MLALAGSAAALARATHESFPVLTALIVTPLVGAALAMVMPARRPEYSRIVGYLATAATLGLAIYLLVQFSATTHGYQFVESHRWMGEFGVRYSLGVDGISLFMVALTALLFPIGLLASAEIKNPKAFTV
jgi:NADH-quinone oxidoreductase subunit M